MEVFKNETDEIIRRFVAGKISHHECVAALDAAVSGLVPCLKPEELTELRAIMLANSETLAREVQRRKIRPQAETVN
jgi:hypothetical protein